MNHNLRRRSLWMFLLFSLCAPNLAEVGVASTDKAQAVPKTQTNSSTASNFVDAVAFTDRCKAPGVFRCIGFDNDSDFVNFGGPPSQTVYPNSQGNFTNITKDCSTAVKGCSIRLTVPADASAGPNMAGKYEYDFVKDGKRFGQNSTFYVQIRVRFDQAMVRNKFGGEGWKFVLIYGGKTSCSNLGLLNQNTWYYGFPTMVHECSPGIYTMSGSTQYMEQGDYNCAYSRFNKKDCAYFHENEWMTFYWKIHVGEWGKPNSSLDAWIGFGNGPLKKWVYQPNFVFNYQNDSNDVLDKVALTPYTTGRQEAAPSDGHMWFDELIVSSEPIPAPNGPTPQ